MDSTKVARWLIALFVVATLLALIVIDSELSMQYIRFTGIAG